MEEEEAELQGIAKVIRDCCKKKTSIGITIFDPITENSDEAWLILGSKYKRHDTMQDDCLVTHLNAENVCGYKSVEIIMFRDREKGGDKK